MVQSRPIRLALIIHMVALVVSVESLVFMTGLFVMGMLILDKK